MNFDAQCLHHGNFYGQRVVGSLCRFGVCDLDVVGFVASHHLVAGDAIGDGVHNGPLRGGGLPAAVGFALWKFYDATATNIHVQFVILNKDAAPDDFAGFAHAFAGAAAEWKIHAGLALEEVPL